MKGFFEVYQDTKGEYRFRLKAPNGETILASEGYTAKAGVTNGIKSVKENAVMEARYEAYQDKAGKHRFRLKAANAQTIGVSEGYETEATLKGGMGSVKKWAPEAEVKEL